MALDFATAIAHLIPIKHNANAIKYDNTTSGLADNVQGAIDELDTIIESLTLADILAVGNNTGGNNITVDSGDQIEFNTITNFISATDPATLVINAGGIASLDIDAVAAITIDSGAAFTITSAAGLICRSASDALAIFGSGDANPTVPTAATIIEAHNDGGLPAAVSGRLTIFPGVNGNSTGPTTQLSAGPHNVVIGGIGGDLILNAGFGGLGNSDGDVKVNVCFDFNVDASIGTFDMTNACTFTNDIIVNSNSNNVSRFGDTTANSSHQSFADGRDQLVVSREYNSSLDADTPFYVFRAHGMYDVGTGARKSLVHTASAFFTNETGQLLEKPTGGDTDITQMCALRAEYFSNTAAAGNYNDSNPHAALAIKIDDSGGSFATLPQFNAIHYEPLEMGGNAVTDFCFMRMNVCTGTALVNVHGLRIAELSNGTTSNREIFLEGAGEIFFRDSALSIGSQTDGHIDHIADISHDFIIGSNEEVRIAANTLIFNSGSDDPVLDWSVDGELALTNGLFKFDEGLTANVTAFTSGPVTLDATHFQTTFDATTGNITVNLPAISGIEGRIYNIKKIDVSINTVTIDGNGAETIDGATTLVIAFQYDAPEIIAGASEWHVR